MPNKIKPDKEKNILNYIIEYPTHGTRRISPNHLNRNFIMNKLNQFWVADITHIYIQEGWLYLSTLMACIPAKLWDNLRKIR